jgi:hypothetical protein
MGTPIHQHPVTRTGFAGRSLRSAGIALLACAALFVARPAASQSCNLVVDPLGAGDFVTIADAVDHFQDTLGNLGPCTIQVRAGSYESSIKLIGLNSGATSEAQRVVIQGERGPNGEFLSAFNTGRRDAVSVKTSRFVTLKDFEVLTGTNKPIAIEAASNVEIKVENIFGHDNGGGRDSGCIFVGDGNQGIWLVNNICFDNGSNSISIGLGGPHFVIGNIVFDHDKGGIVIEKGADVYVYNNLVLFNGLNAGGTHYGIDIQTKGGGPDSIARVVSNIVYGNDADIHNESAAAVFLNNQTTATLPVGLTASSFFEDAASRDFHHAQGSPALGAGADSTGTTPERVPETDFEGDARISPIDVGADEANDADFDGVPDTSDNCPPGLNSSFNPDQGDEDGDGVGNYCDNCPDFANPGQEDIRGFDAFGNEVPGPNLRGDACDADIGETLFDLGAGPPETAVLVTTFGALDDVVTVPPDCLTTYFYCEDGAGNPIARSHRLFARGIPDSLVSYPAGTQVTIACPVSDLFPLAALTDSTVTCKACYDNEHRDLDLAENGSCSDPFGCVDNFLGIACSADQSLTFDSTPREGCSPGYWKNRLASWPVSQDADFDTTFGVDFFEPDITLLEAVNLGGGDENALARHAAAALLNTQDAGVDYSLPEGAVKALVQSGDVYAALQLLSSFNNAGCPLN